MQTDSKKQRGKGIYLLPNLLTTAGLFAAFYSIVAAMKGQFEVAAVAIFVAMVADAFDGRIARLTNTQSAFGGEYDSLADMVSFGVAPALVVYSWSLHSLGKLGWLAAFVFTAAAGLRLARFNTQIGVVDKRYFQGLASPSAAGVVASIVWFGHDFAIPGNAVNVLIAFITVAMALLMVSNVRYYSFKDIDFRGKVPFIAVLLVVLVFVGISIDPPLVLLLGFAIYALSGPVLTLFRMKKLRQRAHRIKKKGQVK